jgi:transglutaminase-like putative cysteine protease
MNILFWGELIMKINIIVILLVLFLLNSGIRLTAQTGTSGSELELPTIGVRIFMGQASEISVADRSKLGTGAQSVTVNGQLDSKNKFLLKKTTQPIKPIQKQDIYGRILGGDFFFYRNTLSKNEQTVYDQVYANALVVDPKFDMPVAITPARFEVVCEAVVYDNPDLFWLVSDFSYSHDGKNVISATLNFKFKGNIEPYKNIFYKCSDSVLEKAMKLNSDIDKVKFIHDLLINICSYESNEYDQTAYSVIVMGKSVCAGYSRAFQYYMQRLGIPCALLIGDAGGPHAWNLVKINGEYYAMDVTWDDPLGARPNSYSYTYFNISDAQFKGERIRDAISKILPAAYGIRYSYPSYYKNQPGSDFSGINYGTPVAKLPSVYFDGTRDSSPVVIASVPSNTNSSSQGITSSSTPAASGSGTSTLAASGTSVATPVAPVPSSAAVKTINITPPAWIYGEWSFTKSREIFSIGFKADDVIVNNSSISQAIKRSEITGFSQTVTSSYYEIKIEYSNGYWRSEKFTRPAGRLLQSAYRDSKAGKENYMYIKK